MEKISAQQTTIHQIPIFPLGMINAFLLVNRTGCILVDTGLPDTQRKIERVLKKLNLGFGDIKLIVITHAHIDHAGNAAKIRELSGAPIVAHRGDLPYYRRQKEMSFCSTGWFGSIFKLTGAIQKPYEAFEPDILLSTAESYSLEKYGLNGEVISTPGHTEGSVSVVIEDRLAVVGDLISSGILLGGIARRGKSKRPPFEDDPVQVSHELQGMTDRGVDTFFMGHGGPLPRAEVILHAKKLNDKTCRKH